MCIIFIFFVILDTVHISLLIFVFCKLQLGTLSQYLITDRLSSYFPFLSWCNKLLKVAYRNLPNKGIGRSSKVISKNLGTKLTVLAFKRWFPIENRTNIKEIMVIFGDFWHHCLSPNLGGRPYYWRAPLIGRLRYYTLQYQHVIIFPDIFIFSAWHKNPTD